MFGYFKAPPPDGRELIGRARRRGKPAWDLYRDGDRVILGWAVHSSECAVLIPLGRIEEVEVKFQEWLGAELSVPLHQ